jgi:hypothetical protein
MSRDADIKKFAQATLGCGCPEEVFKIIECRANIILDGIQIRDRINIGNRLLIYVVEVGRPDSVEKILKSLVIYGRKERDSAGFNRFRLVLTADDIGIFQRDAETIFKSINSDEKVHLHLIRKADIHI